MFLQFWLIKFYFDLERINSVLSILKTHVTHSDDPYVRFYKKLKIKTIKLKTLKIQCSRRLQLEGQICIFGREDKKVESVFISGLLHTIILGQFCTLAI